MPLVESLLTAIVRADGDALVMHVGEKPYVVASAGPIELSTQGLNLQAMSGMTAQLLPPEAQRALTEFGAVEHELPSLPATPGERFTVVVARGGDDVWIEIRRHRGAQPAESPTAATTQFAAQGELSVVTPGAATEPHVSAAASAEPIATPAAVMDTPLAAAAEPATTDTRVADAHAQPSASDAVVDAPVPEPAIEQETATPAAAELEPALAANLAEPALADDERQRHSEREPHTAWTEHGRRWPGELEPQTTSAHAGEHAHEPAINPVQDAPAALAPEHQTAPDEATSHHFAAPPTPEPTPHAAEAPSPMEVSASVEARETVVEIPFERPQPVAAAASSSAGSNSTPAAVIPMTRTVRIEVPPVTPTRHQPPRMSLIERLLGIAAARGASALFLTTQAAPRIRVDADMLVLEGEPALSSTDVEAAVLELMPDDTRDGLRQGEPAEWVSDFANVGPVRCSTFRDHRGPGAIFQLISMRPITAATLGLSAEIQALATESEGLVLVASPRANGKTTLVGSLVDLINRERPTYVVTLERQIRVIHENQIALISQREIRGSAEEMLSAARNALRESPDVLVVEDLSSAEMFQLALDAAGGGVLVIASVTAPSTTAALIRLVELFPVDKRRAVQSLLAERLRGAVAQMLLRKSGGGRAAAREVLLVTSAIARVIGDGQLHELPAAIESGRKYGLVSLTEALVEFVRSGAIDLREAYRKADDRDALVAALKRENLDSALLERLA